MRFNPTSFSPILHENRVFMKSFHMQIFAQVTHKFNLSIFNFENTLCAKNLPDPAQI